MKTIKAISFFLSFICLMMFSSCTKEVVFCFDKKMYDKHRNDICPMDCPGVNGCDGRIYCNECIANSLGIHVIK